MSIIVYHWLVNHFQSGIALEKNEKAILNLLKGLAMWDCMAEEDI